MLTYEFRSPQAPHAMPIALSLNAISLLNQLSRSEAQRIERALERLASNYDLLLSSHVHRVAEAWGEDGQALFSYRASSDIRVFYFIEDHVINVVEIIRKGQIDSLRTLPRIAV